MDKINLALRSVIKINRWSLVVIILSVLFSCGGEERTIIDVTDIQLDCDISRLDKDVFEIDFSDVQESINDLSNRYGDFFKIYNSLIIKLGNTNSPIYSERLVDFVTDYHMNKVYTKTQEVYPDLNALEKEIETAFKYYSYYFPEKTIPKLYSFIGGFNQSVVVSDSILAIGLDKYLGSDCVFYDRLGEPEYMQETMIPELIPFDAIKGWLITEFEYNDSIDNVVNNMIHQGKIHYALKSLFPEANDSLIFAFSSEDIKWCNNNEKEMWNYLIDQKLLFSSDYMTINQLINPAPFTSGFPKESPGRACVWLGEQIVSSYMKRNKDVSLHELMLNKKYQKILSESRYEP